MGHNNFRLYVLHLYLFYLPKDMAAYNICSCFVDLESCHKQVETDKKAVDELIRERDNLNKVHVTVMHSLDYKC